MSWRSAAYSSERPRFVAQGVARLRPVEELQGQVRRVARVGLVVLAALGQGHHAAPPHVGIGLGPGQGARMAVDVVEEDAFPQRPLAEHQLLHAQPAQDGVEDHRPHGQDVGPRLVDAGQAEPLAKGQAAQALAQLGDRGRAHRDVVEGVGHLSRLDLVGHAAEGEDGARGSDGAEGLRALHRFLVRCDRLLDERLEPGLVLAREGIAAAEPLGHAQDSELLGGDPVGPGARAQGQLHASPAHVHHQGPLSLEVNGVERGQVDEPGLALPRGHAGPDAGLFPDPDQIVLAVPGLPNGGGGHGQDLVDAVAGREPLVLVQDLESAAHGGGGQAAPGQGGGAQADHLLLARHHLEAARRADFDDDEVDRVRSEVDGGDFHGSGSRSDRAGVIVPARSTRY